jgi:hypothetical protein
MSERIPSRHLVTTEPEYLALDVSTFTPGRVSVRAVNGGMSCEFKMSADMADRLGTALCEIAARAHLEATVDGINRKAAAMQPVGAEVVRGEA